MDSHEVTGTIKEWEGRASGTAQEMAGKIEKTYGQAKDKIEDLGNETSDQEAPKLADRASEAWEDGMDLVRQYPGAAVGYSLLAGIVIGALIGYASRD